jgi:hypothetical protein
VWERLLRCRGYDWAYRLDELNGAPSLATPL